MDNTTSRRRFLTNSASVAVAGAVMTQLAPSIYAAGSDAIKVGLVGCGGRGSGAAAQALSADKGAVLTAVGDAFADRMESTLKGLQTRFAEKVEVPAGNKFVGFDAYKQVIASGVDVVILATPPGFRPVQLRACVEAGKHVFTEKPMAVDAPGYRSILETVEMAKQKNLGMVAGFCYRYNNGERAFFKKLQEGAIGQVLVGHSTYNTAELWMKPRQPGWSDMEWQLRNWLYFTWLSGDHLVEQAVHSVDKMVWGFGDRSPVRCVAHGGRQVRTDPAYGHIFDHFSIVYDWADGARSFLYCRQQAGTASDVSDLFVGDKGRGNIVAFRSQEIFNHAGQPTWKYDGPKNDMYQQEHNELFASIRAGKPLNDGVRMANSTMIAIMGRMAAYTGQMITWDQAINSKESLVPANLEWGSLPMPPVPMPGKTKFF